jgi:hypothetical protein
MTGLPDFDIDRGTLLGAAAGAITAFGLRGRTSHEDNVALAEILLDKQPHLHRSPRRARNGFMYIV